MTIHAISLTNPGAELGDATGWTQTAGSGLTAVSGGSLPASNTNAAPHSGTYCFRAGSSATNTWYQSITVDAGWEVNIDAGLGAIKFSGWHTTDASSSGNDSGTLFIQALASDNTTVLATAQNDHSTHTTSWVQEFIEMGLPPNTRYIRVGTTNARFAFTENSNFWDDFLADVSDDHVTDWPGEFVPQAKQLGVYALGTFPTEEIRDHQSGVLSLAASETDNTFFETYAHQLGIYVLCRPNADRRDLRAWPFTQDDHDFWVIQLGSIGTLVYDTLTDQWAQWRSPGYAYWRGNDGVQWEGWNIACDTESGKLWIIDPEGRLDEDTTPITSVVTGGLSVRMRKNVPCYMGELTVSEGDPPSGFDDGSVGITLRTSDDQGNTYVNHGEVLGQGIGEDMTVRWYSLGNIPATGRVFEITDTGYARRIDGFNVEVPDDG